MSCLPKTTTYTTNQPTNQLTNWLYNWVAHQKSLFAAGAKSTTANGYSLTLCSQLFKSSANDYRRFSSANLRRMRKCVCVCVCMWEQKKSWNLLCALVHCATCRWFGLQEKKLIATWLQSRSDECKSLSWWSCLGSESSKKEASFAWSSSSAVRQLLESFDLRQAQVKVYERQLRLQVVSRIEAAAAAATRKRKRWS